MNSLFESKTEKFKRTHRLVASHFPIKQFDHLSLFSLVANKTKNDIIKTLLIEYLESMPNEVTLIQDLCASIMRDWDEKKEENTGKVNWSNAREIGLRKRQYKDAIIKNLNKSKISADHIHDIMFKIESELI